VMSIARFTKWGPPSAKTQCQKWFVRMETWMTIAEMRKLNPTEEKPYLIVDMDSGEVSGSPGGAAPMIHEGGGSAVCHGRVTHFLRKVIKNPNPIKIMTCTS
jgi:hypothetical protein